MPVSYSPEEIKIRREERGSIVASVRETAKAVPVLAAMVLLNLANEIVREGEMLYGTEEHSVEPVPIEYGETNGA